MCVTSAVFNQYAPYIPSQPYIQPYAPQSPQPFTLEEWRELIDSFYQALEAAKKFDRLTNQPDCEDPDKAKLLDRVAELETRLNELESR